MGRKGWMRGRGVARELGLVALLGLLLALPTTAARAAGPVAIKVLSTRADLVAGGEALVEVTGGDATGLRADVDGRDVSGAIALRTNGRVEGLVTGLALGRNRLSVHLPDGGGAAITITNHPAGGPVFSGPQILPWTCPAGAADAQCDMPATFSYQYKNAITGQFSSYDPNNPPPGPEVATTTTDQGKTVPYIVRQETGMEDRDQYQIAVLFDPAKGWEPWAPQDSWNGKLLYNGGASCGVNHGAGSAPSTLVDMALKRGFAVASTALDNNGHNCNLVVQAESIEMAKEHFVNHYGEIRYTIGNGCSGGSIFQQQDTNAYPGLLDALQPMCSFPDDWSTSMDPTECALLLSYWNTGSGSTFTETQQAAVAGDSTISVCQSWVNVYRYSQGGSPSQTNSAIIPCGVTAQQEYNASSNPGGVRCDLQDYMVDELGHRPPSVWTANETKLHQGFANRPFDNIGVQYGLNQLKDGTITPSQFADMNAAVGGFDIDFNPTPNRTAADPFAVQAVYREGLVNEGNNLAGVPIIDLRGHDDSEIHSDFRSYVMRARLDKANGGHGNQIVWTGPAALTGDAKFADQAFQLIDGWTNAVKTDNSNLSPAQKVVAHKPAGAVDTCFDGAGDHITDTSTCLALYPYYSDPRIQAGMPFTDDVIKCQLKPLNRGDYPVQFTDSDWAKLQAAFPTGVCDWSKPGMDQAATVPWLDYSQGPGGVPMGPAPKSVPISGDVQGASTGALPTTSTAGPGALAVVVLVVLCRLVAAMVRRRRASSRGGS